MIKKIPKLRQKIVEIMGDYYYKEMEVEEVVEIVCQAMPKDKELKNQADLDRMIEENLN